MKLNFETEIDGPQAFMDTHDIVLAADGLNSRSRAAFADVFKPDIDVRKCKFVWLGTHQKFDDAFTFIFERTEHGWVWAHAYQFDRDTATFIVECSQETWDRFGFGDMSKEESIETCERIFEKYLGGYFRPKDLWAMVTQNAARVAKMDSQIGVLAVGHLGDISVFAPQPGMSPFEAANT